MKKKNVMDVVDIKNHTADAIEKVHTWTFIFFEILIYVILDRIVLSRLLPNSIWGEIVRAVAFALGYLGLYVLVKYILNKIIIKKRCILDIASNEPWYHVHIPDDSLAETENIESLSAGITYISRNLNDFTFKAENFKYTVDRDGIVKKLNNEPSTTWHTETSEICEGNEIHILEIYKASSDKKPTVKIRKCPVCKRNYGTAKTVNEAPQQRYGIHLYKIRSSNEIVATYSDCWPSLKSGKLYLFRNKNDRDEKIKDFFKTHS